MQDSTPSTQAMNTLSDMAQTANGLLDSMKTNGEQRTSEAPVEKLEARRSLQHVQGTPTSVASPMLKQQMAAWTRVIDQAEKEIARKSSESQFLKNKLRQAEFDVASKVCHVILLIKHLSLTGLNFENP